jgi:hypothetical protein
MGYGQKEKKEMKVVNTLENGGSQLFILPLATKNPK